MSIANSENMVSNAERRGIILEETPVVPRLSDLAYLAAGTRGKIELTMSEDDGQEDRVIEQLLGEAVKKVFANYFGDVKPFRPLMEWFESGRTFTVGDQVPSMDYVNALEAISFFRKEGSSLLQKPVPEDFPEEAKEAGIASIVEFILEGLHVENRLNKNHKGRAVVFSR